MILFSDLLSCSQIMRHQFSDGPLLPVERVPGGYRGPFVAYHHSGSLQLVTSVRAANVDDHDNNPPIDIHKHKSYLLTDVYGRYFFGNSFNMAAGLGFYRSVLKYSETYYSSDDFSGKVTMNSLVLPISIGNMWSPLGLTLGCDWIGLIIPIWGQTSGRISGPVSNADADTINKQQLRVAKAGASENWCLS